MRTTGATPWMETVGGSLSRLVIGGVVFAFVYTATACAERERQPTAPVAREVAKEVPMARPTETNDRPVAPAAAPRTFREVRPAILAGAWYPGEPAKLRAMVDGWLSAGGGEKASVGKRPAGAPLALVVPHAGYRYSGETAAGAYARLQDAPVDAVRRVVLLGPSHRVRFSGVALPEADAFETPLGPVPLDLAFMEKLQKLPNVVINDAAHRNEHSLEIQLPLLQRALDGRDWQLVPLVVGRLDETRARRLGVGLAELMEPGTVLVISTDFTHYGSNFAYVPFKRDVPEQLRQLDMGLWEHVAARRLDDMFAYERRTGITACGFLPMAVMVAALPEGATADVLAYDTSGAMTGDFGNSVSYLAAAFDGPAWGSVGETEDASGPAAAEHPLTVAEKQTLLRLARDTAEAYVREGRTIDPTSGADAARYELTPRLHEKSGAFVTLKKHGDLRGCIGEIFPRRPLWLVVRDHAIDAAVHDTRFRPVTPAELPQLHVEVSVLTPPREVASWRDIVIGRDGVLLGKSGRRAVFLPQVAPEQGWDVVQTLDALNRKAGLPRGAWREGATYEVFEAIVFEEDEGAHR